MASYGPRMMLDDVVQVTFASQFNEQIGENVLHWVVKVVNDDATDTLDHIAKALHFNGVMTAYRALMTSQATFLGCLVQIIQGHPSIAFTDFTDSGVGGVAGDALPRQVAGFIRKKSAVPGRRLSGRMYIPFPGETDNAVGSVPTAGYNTNLLTLANSLTGLLTWGAAGSAAPVIYQRPRLGPPPESYHVRAIDSWIPQPKWASQRRRGSFGRPNVNPFA